MKLWKKTSKWEFGDTILAWRYRDAGRLLGKVFSWLLGGFVFGILTSIFFAAIQKPEAALPAARFVFFAVFFLGILSNLFRAVFYGYEYKITQQAIVQPHPFYGWEKLGLILGSAEKPFRQVNYFLEWQEIKEIREFDNRIGLVLEEEREIEVPVYNVKKLVMNLNLNKPEPKVKGTSKSEKLAYDKAVLRIVLQAAREARRNAANSNKDD